MSAPRELSPRRRRAVWVVVVLGLVGVVAWQANAWNPPTTDTDQAGGTSIRFGDETGLTVYPIAQRPAAPNLEGVTLDGDQFALSDLSGQVVVLNVWGSWCSPCRAEAPDLARLARETESQGVRFVGIDTRDSTAAARAFVRSFDIPYPSVVDPDGQLLLQFEGIIPITAVPSTLIIDSRGNVAAKVVGQITYSTLRGLIDDELARSIERPSQPAPRGAQ